MARQNQLMSSWVALKSYTEISSASYFPFRRYGRYNSLPNRSAYQDTSPAAATESLPLSVLLPHPLVPAEQSSSPLHVAISLASTTTPASSPTEKPVPRSPPTKPPLLSQHPVV